MRVFGDAPPEKVQAAHYTTPPAGIRRVDAADFFVAEIKNQLENWQE